MIQKHCFECGTALVERELDGEGVVPYCPECQQFRFPMYNVAVSMIVINEQNGTILLIKQYGKPSFVLVAGYVNRGEQVEHAVGREIKEETGLKVTFIDGFRHTLSYSPAPGVSKDVVYFLAAYESGKEKAQKEELQGMDWFTYDEATAMITYPNDRDLLVQAAKFLAEK